MERRKFTRSHQHWPWARAEGGSHHAADPADEANRDTLMQLPSRISIGPEKVLNAISGVIKAGTKVVSPDPKSAVPGHFWGQHQRAQKRGPIIIPETAENPAKPALKRSNPVSFTPPQMMMTRDRNRPHDSQGHDHQAVTSTSALLLRGPSGPSGLQRRHRRPPRLSVAAVNGARWKARKRPKPRLGFG